MFLLSTIQMFSIENTTCTLVNKGWNNSGRLSCPYVFQYTVIIPQNNNYFQVCSGSKDVLGQDSGAKGPRVCHAVYGASLNVFNLMTINNTYTCFYYPSKQYVFLDDPRPDIYGLYLAGIFFMVLCCSCFLIYMGTFWLEYYKSSHTEPLLKASAPSENDKEPGAGF